MSKQENVSRELVSREARGQVQVEGVIIVLERWETQRSHSKLVLECWEGKHRQNHLISSTVKPIQ